MWASGAPRDEMKAEVVVVAFSGFPIFAAKHSDVSQGCLGVTRYIMSLSNPKHTRAEAAKCTK